MSKPVLCPIVLVEDVSHRRFPTPILRRHKPSLRFIVHVDVTTSPSTFQRRLSPPRSRHTCPEHEGYLPSKWQEDLPAASRCFVAFVDQAISPASPVPKDQRGRPSPGSSCAALPSTIA